MAAPRGDEVRDPTGAQAGQPEDSAAIVVTRDAVAVAGLDIDEVEVAWHRGAPGAPAASGSGRGNGLVVVLTHGAGGNLDDPGLVALADVVAGAGHTAVRCNMPYRQRRPKGPPPRGNRGLSEFAAMLAGVAMATPDAASWVIGGKSYGGRLATMLAAGVEGATDVVAAAAMPRPLGVLCHSYPLHPPGKPDRLRVDHWHAVEVPILFLQGTNDPFGAPDELSPHLSRLGAPATVLSVAGGDHSLRVPRTRSTDGATHAPAAVIADLGPDTVRWLERLADA